MHRRHSNLIAVLATFVALTFFVADASAMYHPGIGRFVQRDPGPSNARIGSAGAASGGGFIPRDQYTDGMNLYQYMVSSPLNGSDPSGLLVIYAEGAVRTKKAKGLETLSDLASKKFEDYAESTEQQYHFAQHRKGGWGGGWNDQEMIQTNAEAIVQAILATPDETISMFAHSTGAATAVRALELLRVENRKRKAECPKRIDVLYIYAGTATRRPDLKNLFAELVDHTTIGVAGRDKLVKMAADRGNADGLGGYNLGQVPLVQVNGREADQVNPSLMLAGRGTRADGSTWLIDEMRSPDIGHSTFFELDEDGRQPWIESIIKYNM